MMKQFWFWLSAMLALLTSCEREQVWFYQPDNHQPFYTETRLDSVQMLSYIDTSECIYEYTAVETPCCTIPNQDPERVICK